MPTAREQRAAASPEGPALRPRKQLRDPKATSKEEATPGPGRLELSAPKDNQVAGLGFCSAVLQLSIHFCLGSMIMHS